MRKFLLLLAGLLLVPALLMAKVDWLIGPNPDVQGGVANKLKSNYKAIVKITANGVTRTFTFERGTKGSTIGFWSLGKNTYHFGPLKWETQVIDKKTGKVIDKNSYTMKKVGEGTIVNMNCPFIDKKAKFKMKITLKAKGPANLYLKEGLSTIGKERLYLLFTLQ